MYYIHHVHNATASAQSLLLSNFLPSGPCLCVVKHASLSFLTLAEEDADSALKEVLSVPINGRILRLARIKATEKSSTIASDRIAVLTDHHQPRLFVLHYNQTNQGIRSVDFDANASSSSAWSPIETKESILLEELGRPAAESGLTLEVEEGIGALYAYCHTHAGKLKVARLKSESAGTTQGETPFLSKLPDLAHAFSLRLPHPHLISSTFMARRGGEPSPSQIALLSLSSTASRLPGLGMQCLPVLSFHAIDEVNQELPPVVWGPPRKIPSKEVSEKSLETTNEDGEPSTAAKGRRKSSQSNDVEPSSGAGSKPAKAGRHGPAAKGASRTAEEEAAHEEQLAKTPLTRAHVPLPFSDALGAHLLLALPARAGGGVLVFSETSVMLVPPPPSSTDAKDSGALRSPKSSSSSKVAGKRRKSSSGEIVTSARRQSASSSQTTTADSALSVSPTATMTTAPRSNENGKRRRSTAGSSSTINPTTDGTTRRRSSSAASVSSQRILRMGLPVPVIVASAIVIKEPLGEEDDGVRIDSETGKGTLNVIFATHSGRLELLTITLQNMASDQSDVEQFAPISLSTQKLGEASAAGGPDALAYLGDNFLHISSTSGDSLLLRINDQIGEETGNQFSIVKRWSNLAPILDFVADDGAGGSPSAAGSAQARIITCSGSGPTGSLRVIRDGVALEDLASIEEAGIRRIWDIEGTTSKSTAFLLLGLSQGARVVSFGQAGIEDHTYQFTQAGLDANQSILDAASLGAGLFAVVNSSGVKVLQSEQASIKAQWQPSDAKQLSLGSEPITRAAVNSAGQVLLAFQTGDMILLQIRETSIELIAATKLPSEISAIDISPLTTEKGSSATLATVALWRPAIVKIFTIPDLRDATPSALMASHPSLIRSVKLHTFSINGASTSLPHLMIGLGNGTLTTHSLSLPTKDSISQTIGVLERRTTSLGTQPLHLRSFITAQGLHAVFAASDKSTVVFSQGTGLTYSSVRHQDVSDISQFDFSVNPETGVDRLMIFATPERLQVAKMGEISQVDIETIDLGYDNPLAISMCTDQKVVGVVTTRFLSQGRGSEPIEGGKVILRDAEQFTALDEYVLEMEERPNCIDTFERGGANYFVVGTGYTFPDRTETTSGRLLLLRISPRSKKLQLVTSRNVDGNVFDLKAIGGKRIIACVNAKVLSFEMEDDYTAMDEESDGEEDKKFSNQNILLIQVGQWACAFTATSLSISDSNKVVVGDALRSIVILRMDEQSGKLVELARDCDPYWTVSCNCIDEEEEVYCGSDIAFNIWTCRRLKWTQSAKDRLERSRLRETETGSGRSAAGSAQNGVDLIDQTWSHIMQRDGAFHYGDLINKMKRGSLVSDSGNVGSANSKTGSNKSPVVQSRIIFGTAAGAIGLLAKLDERAGRILSQLEVKIADSFKPIGEIATESYRTLRTDHRTQPSAGFIDGIALCNAFDPLNNEARVALIRRGRLPIDADLDEVNNLVESLQRLS
ncbi:uncharacterized protein FA14DRAFT_78463 [Meira miltonrushii]|uniref:DNA damage-binding protein 1 n=1 Tax=Meira miltonrushii TaxID=1280837 RepID=A0A316V5T4_9BASI|nr:uncharacterized protein FA14DRAFT_78463 [Meira miltonrushii]PWN32832.1 hypothetical protein FA14DRAFT_78463 [Meira miltonrushii]